MARVSGARNVLELGSGFGYSAYWFAQGLKDDGHVRCTDYSSEFRELARQFFKKAETLWSELCEQFEIPEYQRNLVTVRKDLEDC